MSLQELLVLKQEMLIYAGYLVPGESMTAQDASMTLKQTASRICADRNSTSAAIALITTLLAEHIDRREGA